MWTIIKAIADLVWAMLGLAWHQLQFAVIIRWYGRERIEQAFLHSGMRPVRTRDGRIYTFKSGNKVEFTDDKVIVIGPDF